MVSEAWQRWVAENLLLGVEPGELVQGLVDGGVPQGLAQRTVAGIAASPGLAVARAWEREARRLSTARFATHQASHCVNHRHS